MDYQLLTSDGSYRSVTIFELKELYESGRLDLRDVARRDQRHWLIGEILGQSLGSARVGWRGVPLPMPPSISWWTVALVGGITGGYGWAVISLLQGLWSRRVQRRVAPVLLPLFSLVAVPLHLILSIAAIVQRHPPIWKALLHLIGGVVITDALAVMAVLLASLSIRKTLLSRYAQEGFEMSWFLTLVCGPIYVAYKAHELRETAR